MEINEKIWWEESQKFRENWVWQLVIVSSLTSVGIVIGMMVSEHAEWYAIAIPVGLIVLMDSLVIAIFRTMRLDLAVTRKGLCYRMWPRRTYLCIGWNEIKEIQLKKPPATAGYGKKFVPGYGKVYSMGRGKGLELHLQNGKKIFFSTQQPDLFRSVLQKAEIQIPVTTP
jgi:hypothetical protein